MSNLKSILENLIKADADEQSSQLIKLIFGGVRKKSQLRKKTVLRPVLIGSVLIYQFEDHLENKVLHSNLNRDEALLRCLDLITEDFKQINGYYTDREVQILAAKIDCPKFIEKPLTATLSIPDLEHNKRKNYIIQENIKCDFLIKLGVMEDTGRIVRKHYAKFKQINRYLEIVADCMYVLTKDRTTDKPLKIIDFGCGKAYLTFALYYYLKILEGRDVEIIGLDLKKDVIDFCNAKALELDYEGLSFLHGDIADYANNHADMVITLHACDTATDYALINAVKWHSRVILSVPCCQHELFSQIDNPLHEPMFKHGIIKDKFTELLTDALRGLKLEENGYEVSMVEFTSLEHTSKNILIRAVLPQTSLSQKRKDKAAEEYKALKDYYGVKPTIDNL